MILKTLFNHPRKSITLLLCTLCYLFALYLTPNSLTLGLTYSFVFTALCYMITRNITTSLFIAFFASSLFLSPAKSYPFEIASVTQYRYEAFQVGVFDSVDITIADILGFFLFINLLRIYISKRFSQNTKRNQLNRFGLFTLIGFFSYFFFIVISLYTTSTFSPFPSQGMIIALQQSKIIVAFLSVWLLLKHAKSQIFFYLTLIAVYLFLTIMGTYKFISGLTAYGYLQVLLSGDIEQSALITRAASVGNPNAHALFIGVLLFITLPFVWKLRRNSITYVYALIGIFNIIASQSRTIWVAFVIIFVITSLLYKRYVIRFISLFTMTHHRYIQMFAFSLIALIILLPRIVSSSLFFSETGGGTLRLQMMREGVQLLARKPLTGFGIGSGLKIFFDYFPSGYVYTFPHPVHNTYLQIALEVGTPALLFFLLPFYLIMRKWLMSIISNKPLSHNARSYGTICASLTLLIYFMNQPIYLRAHSVLIGTSLSVGLFHLYGNIRHYG